MFDEPTGKSPAKARAAIRYETVADFAPPLKVEKRVRKAGKGGGDAA